MSRIIKFRAWDLEQAKMFDVSALSNTGSYDRTWEVQPDGERYFTPNAALMQFTGLKDRNGAEIYEGDLLEEEAGYIFEVVWDEEWAKFRLQWRTKAIQYPEWNRGKRMAVVGNVFSNPELLERP